MAVTIRKSKRKKWVIKRIPKFKDYKNCLQNDKMILKSQLILIMLKTKIEQNITQNSHTLLTIHTG